MSTCSSERIPKNRTGVEGGVVFGILSRKTLKEVDFNKGLLILIELPSRGVVVMTTIETGTSVLMK